jgi:hypothetical protein
VSVFLAFHLIAITCWAVPLNTRLFAKAKEALAPYMLWSGLFQAWDMFAPDPSKVNAYIQGVVTLRNGQTRTWSCPRMQELSLVQRYFKERYRKFGNERLRMDENVALWPDAARYVARMFAGDPANPPVRVQLVRYWTFVGPPGSSEAPGPLSHYVYFVYPVRQEDLR